MWPDRTSTLQRAPGVLDVYRHDATARFYLLSIVSLAAILFGLAIHSVPLGGDEGDYSAVAKCTLKTGDWLTLRIGPDCKTHFVKGPLFYGLLALSIKLFGTTEAALRVPNLLASVGITVLMFHLVFRVTRDAVRAFLAGVILLTTNQVVFYHREAITDPLIIFFMTLGLTAYVLQPDRRWALFLVGFLSTFPMLIKPLFPAFLLLAVLLHLFLTDRRDLARSVHLWSGVVTGALAFMLWNAHQYWLNGPTFLWEYWGIGLLGTGDPAAPVERPGDRVFEYVSGLIPKYHDHAFHWDTPFFYPLWLALFYHPWLAFVPASVAHGWRAGAGAEQKRFGRLAVVFLVLVLLALSAARWRAPSYLLLVYPMLAALIAVFVELSNADSADRLTGWFLAVLVVFKLGQLGYVAATPGAILPAGWRFELALTAISIVMLAGWRFRRRLGRHAPVAAGVVAWMIMAAVYLSLLIRPQRDMTLPRLRSYAVSNGRPVVLYAPDDWLTSRDINPIWWYFDGLKICREARCVIEQASMHPVVLSTNDASVLRSQQPQGTALQFIAKFHFKMQLDDKKDVIATRDMYALEFTSSSSPTQ